MELLDRDVWKLAGAKFGNAEGGREVQGRRWHLRPWCRLKVITEFKSVQSRAASEQGMQGILRDSYGSKIKVLQVGKMDVCCIVWELAAAEFSDEEGGREAQCRMRYQRGRPNPGEEGEIDLLELVEGRGSEPTVQCGVVILQDEWRGAETTSNALVLGEDAGDDGLTDSPQAASLEVEGCRAPEGAPPGREDLGAGTLLGGKEGDDAAQDLVREKADQICASYSSSASRRRLVVIRSMRFPRLRLSAGHDAHGGFRLLGATLFFQEAAAAGGYGGIGQRRRSVGGCECGRRGDKAAPKLWESGNLSGGELRPWLQQPLEEVLAR